MKAIKENNNGFSLMEIIVTIAIIAIIVVPFMRSFFLAMDINVDARHVQNATMVAQDVMEQFKAKTIDEMIQYSKDVYSVEPEITNTPVADDIYDRQFPTYVFKDWQLSGADGEDFKATITVDAVPYTESGSTGKNPVNSLTSPQFSSLFGSDVVMLFKQYTEPDGDLESYFRATGDFTEDELASLNPSKVKKSTVMDIVCSYNSSNNDYEYVITLDMTYTYDNSKSVLVSKVVNKTYADENGHSIYLMLPVYDTYSINNGTDAAGNYYASDKLSVNYEYIGVPECKPELGLYIAEQVTTHKSAIVDAKIKSENVTIFNKSNSGSSSKKLYQYDNDGNNFKVYTNIQKSLSDVSTLDVKGLTYSEKSDDTLLYEITVEIKYKDEEEVLTSLTSSKED